MAGVGDQCNRQLVSAVPTMDQYQKSGFQPGWTMKRYAFTASRALEGLANVQLLSSVARIVPASEADFENVFTYGTDMLGRSQACKLLLAAWLSHIQESSWAALDNNTGEVVRYWIMSKTVLFSKDGYRVAPFFADSGPIARSLLSVAAEFASTNTSEQIMFLDVAADFNQYVSLRTYFVRSLQPT